jgi:hypothetical protein
MNHCYRIDEGDRKRLVKTWLKMKLAERRGALA